MKQWIMAQKKKNGCDLLQSVGGLSAWHSHTAWSSENKPEEGCSVFLLFSKEINWRVGPDPGADITVGDTFSFLLKNIKHQKKVHLRIYYLLDRCLEGVI